MQVSFRYSHINRDLVINIFNSNRRGYVPDVILATIELPDDLPIVGTGTLIQASVCRPKRDLRSESNAKEISDGLPFLGKILFNHT